MRSSLVAAALALVLSAAAAVPARAGVPTDQLREYTDAVIRVLEDPALKADDRRADRRAAVRRIATDIFDVQEAARRALGTHWPARTPAQRDEFVALFAELLEHAYISKIDLFGGERLRFTEEKVDGENAVVRARIVTRQQIEVPVEARMVRRSDRWLVYDVLVENISLVANYRAQFDRIIRTSSYEELVKRLRHRGEFLREPEPRPRRTTG
jgi:phospholipid transport system substrate-binding protein